MQIHKKTLSSFTLLISIPIFLIIDSPYLHNYTPYAQDIATFLVFLAFARSYRRNSARLRRVMIIGIFIGFTGEIFFSLGLDMYHYRLDNIPLWIGFGHSLIFTSVYKIIRLPFFRANSDKIKQYSLAFIVLYAFFWLYWDNDWFGFLSTLVFLALLLLAKKSQLFFIVMFLIVCYIEIVGTTTLTWYWPKILMEKFAFIPSGNPPVGIAVFYFLFDFVLMHIYFFLFPKVKNKYYSLNPS